MSSRETLLDTAAFLDSEQARALAELPRADVKKIVERFLTCAYDELGVAPKLLDGEGMHSLVGHLLPAHFERKDPLGPAVIGVLRAYLDFLERNAVVIHVFEMRQALESTADEFEEVVRTGSSTHHAHHGAEKPFVHHASKTGRNDPCPCGSGRKFKQCCAKLGA
jgi:hypothetical protein